MKQIVSKGLWMVGLYAVAWTISYSVMMISNGGGLDLSYYFSYFGLAWTFQGGEMPAFILLVSVIIFVVLVVAWVAFFRAKPTSDRNAI